MSALVKLKTLTLSQRERGPTSPPAQRRSQQADDHQQAACRLGNNGGYDERGAGWAPENVEIRGIHYYAGFVSRF